MSELPADIAVAINVLVGRDRDIGREAEVGTPESHWRLLGMQSEARAALEATILRHLSQARERLEDKTNSLRVEIAAKQAAYNDIKAAEAERDAALARAERMEKALRDIAQQDRGGLQGLEEDGCSEDDAVAYLIFQIERRRKIARAALAAEGKD